jgi:hypothetical protein
LITFASHGILLSLVPAMEERFDVSPSSGPSNALRVVSRAPSRGESSSIRGQHHDDAERDRHVDRVRGDEPQGVGMESACDGREDGRDDEALVR